MNTFVPVPPPVEALPEPTRDSAGAPDGERAAPHRPRSRQWVWGLVVVLAFGVGWGLAVRRQGQQAKDVLPPDPGTGGRDPSAVMVTVEPVTYRPIRRAVEGIGTLHGFEEITLSARVEGRVRKVGFDVADRAKPGDLLLEIDPTDYTLAVELAEHGLGVELAKLGLTEVPAAEIDLDKVPSVTQAQARLERARKKFERASGLAGTTAISADAVDSATSDYRAAQAEYANQVLLARAGLATVRMKHTALAVARQQLADTQVRVPTPTLAVPGAADGVSYVITQRAVAEGTLVRVGTEVCRLVINQTLKLRLPVPERYGAEVRPGQAVEVRTAAFAEAFAGTVTRINPSVDPATRTFEVEVQVPNPRGALKPGGFARAAILTRVDAEAATVPLSALVNFAGVNKVFVAEGGRAREMRVTPGVQTTEWVEITTPLLPRDARVVTSGQTALAADTPVALRATSPGETASGAVANMPEGAAIP